MKSINIIGCGPSASLWNGRGDSLGVNDCEKTGKKVKNLLVVDYPMKFPMERFNIIKNSEAEFWTQMAAWQKYKPLMNLINITRWRGYLTPYTVNFSSTSPFVAISLAWTWGYQEIILWGVDMNNGKPYFIEERKNMKDLCACLWKEGVKVVLGSKGSALDFLEVKNG